jgi:hypothetical protein
LTKISRRVRSLQAYGFLRAAVRQAAQLLACQRFLFRSFNVEVGPTPRDGDNYEIWTEVAGVSYNNNRGHPRSRQEIIRRYCRDGNELSLVPEPWNKHSRKGNAVGLWIAGGVGLLGRSRYQVGYVPESDSAEVAEWLRRGKRATAFIWSVVGGGDLYYGLRINIVLHDAKSKADPARPRQKKSKAQVSPKPEILDAGDLGINVDGKPPPQEELLVRREWRSPATVLAEIWFTWIPPMPPPTSHTLRTSIQLAFFEGLAFIAVGILLYRVFGRSSDVLPLGVVLAAVGAGAWGIMTTFSPFTSHQKDQTP